MAFVNILRYKNKRTAQENVDTLARALEAALADRDCTDAAIKYAAKNLSFALEAQKVINNA
jgi:hypothetical protein